MTFLFTDIAGSTGLLSRLGERYAEVLELSEERWKRAIEEGRAMDVETAVAQALESSEVAADG